MQNMARRPREANCVPESSHQRPILYNAEWSSFSCLKEGQRDRITVTTAVTCSLAGRQNEMPHPAATEEKQNLR
ncbi:hypothetical protein CHARACLAT_023337 [Characodon lateralis]|uniref:Uncharacterized protein n=1 Tax=Characodon lateralis TaxID=208331 RepID=A0ABU7D982_9TELE|nr:hypothetical protein [Characodon lateralis]